MSLDLSTTELLHLLNHNPLDLDTREKLERELTAKTRYVAVNVEITAWLVVDTDDGGDGLLTLYVEPSELDTAVRVTPTSFYADVNPQHPHRRPKFMEDASAASHAKAIEKFEAFALPQLIVQD